MERRSLLLTSLGLVATRALSGFSARSPGKPAARLPLVIDGLGEIGDPHPKAGEGPGWTAGLFRDLQASGLNAVNQTVGHVFGPGDPFEMTVREIAWMLNGFRRHGDRVVQIQAAREITACRAQGRVGVILGFQNTRMLGDTVDRVELFANLGVKVIQLTYNDRNAVGDGSMVPENRGLTPFGRDVVAELNRLRTLVDLSHSGERTCLEAIAASKVPVTISHTGCRALCDVPRNKTDREMRLLADHGGVLGVYFMPYLKADSAPRAEDVVRHLEHAIQVCGEDHVALGTDGSAARIADLEAMRRSAAEDVKRRQAAGISAPGESPGVLPLVEDLCGPTQFHKLARLLRARGHSEGRIEKILGGNLLRLYAEVW